MATYPNLTSFPEEQPTGKSWLRDFVEVLLLALALFVIISFAVQTIHVMGPSMQNTLQNNDFLIASKISYRLHEPQRGDIVIFKPSNDSTHDYIKRIIAGPGDRLRISHAQVFLTPAGSNHAHQLREDYLPEPWTWLDTWNEGKEGTVPSGEYFVMGDNRNHSTDSRGLLGFQRKDAFLGKAWIRIWPLNPITVFKSGLEFAN